MGKSEAKIEVFYHLLNLSRKIVIFRLLSLKRKIPVNFLQTPEKLLLA